MHEDRELIQAADGAWLERRYRWVATQVPQPATSSPGRVASETENFSGSEAVSREHYGTPTAAAVGFANSRRRSVNGACRIVETWEPLEPEPEEQAPLAGVLQRPRTLETLAELEAAGVVTPIKMPGRRVYDETSRPMCANCAMTVRLVKPKGQPARWVHMRTEQRYCADHSGDTAEPHGG